MLHAVWQDLSEFNNVSLIHIPIKPVYLEVFLLQLKLIYLIWTFVTLLTAQHQQQQDQAIGCADHIHRPFKTPTQQNKTKIE